MKTILAVLGTRPEAIKMAPVILELQKQAAFQTEVCFTGQHDEIAEEVLDTFRIAPKFRLHIRADHSSLASLSAAMLTTFPQVLEACQPDLVLVHGDTLSAFCAALCCFYAKIPIAHIEAGLRTYRLDAPFPEEWNRRAIGILAALHFAPTEAAAQNLFAEGTDPSAVLVTGNTGLDALRLTLSDTASLPPDAFTGHPLLLLTAHRRENQGAALESIFAGVKQVCAAFPAVRVCYPVHPNPAIGKAAHAAFADLAAVTLCAPLPVRAFHQLLARSTLVLTDSGGLQEEASFLHKPVLILREGTERPEGVVSGGLQVVGTQADAIFSACKTLLTDDTAYQAMAHAPCPYGDGHAAARICDGMRRFFENTRYTEKKSGKRTS